MDRNELNSMDEGVLTVIVERMQEQRYPRALELKEKVDRGETLEDFDIDFLEKVFDDCTRLKPLLDRHPEYQAGGANDEPLSRHHHAGAGQRAGIVSGIRTGRSRRPGGCVVVRRFY